MAASDNSICCDLVGLLKSIVPWRSNRANVSRDFWMPDESCRVCYECDSQFTLFNRRHHCRHCDRVFYGKCTSNWVPAPSSEPEFVHEEWEKIRVCNFCFKQWELGLAGTVDDGNGAHVANLDLSSSPSNTSFITTKSNITANSSSITLASVSHSVGSDQQKLYSSGPSSRNADVVIETNVEREGVVASRRGNEHVADLGDRSPSQFEFRMNRYFPTL